MADIAVTHGGQGTLQTACWAGIPVIGVALQAEQQANIDMLVRAGMGVRVPIKDFNKSRLLLEIDTILKDNTYQQNALHIKKMTRKTDSAVAAADHIQTFLEKRV